MTPDDDPGIPRVVALARLAPPAGGTIARERGVDADVLVLSAGARAADAPADAWLVLDGAVAGLARFDAVAPPPGDAVVPAGARVLAFDAHGAPVERAAAADAGAALGAGRVDPARVTANAFQPVLETPRMACALVSIAAGRRMDAGPESERAFVVLQGSGLVFLQNDTTLPFHGGDLVIVPAGEPARVWCRGPEDVRLVVLQPQTPPAERRSLAGEIAKRRAGQVDGEPGA